MFSLTDNRFRKHDAHKNERHSNILDIYSLNDI